MKEIIDFHTHCFPENIASRAIQSLSIKANLPPYHNGTVEALRAIQKKNGISKSVVLPIATKPSQTKTINEWAASLQKFGDIVPFGSIHPESTDFRNELSAIQALGLKGIKLHPEYQNFFVDDEKYFPLYEEIFKWGLILVLHTGEDLGFAPPFHGTPQRVAKLVSAFKGAKIVAAHMGGYNLWNEVEQYLIGKDIYFDISFAIGNLSGAEFERLARLHGVNKILYGTDLPWDSPENVISALNQLRFTEGEKRKILSENAKTLLDLD